MLSRALCSLALMCLVGCEAFGASVREWRGDKAPVHVKEAKPHATIIPAEIDYVDGEIGATILFDDAAGAAKAVGRLRGPDGFSASTPIEGDWGKCGSVFFTALKGRRGKGGSCTWQVPNPKKGPYTLEVRVGSEVLSSATFELVQVPAYDAKRDFTVAPASRTGFGYVREGSVVTWVPFDLRTSWQLGGYRAIVRRDGKVVQDEALGSGYNMWDDRRASHAVALEATHIDRPGAYEVGFVTYTGDVIGAWSFSITNFDGGSKGVDVWLRFEKNVFGKLTPLPADAAKALFAGMTTTAPGAVDEPRLCARLSDPTYRQAESRMLEYTPHGSVTAEISRLEDVVRQTRASSSAAERESAQRRLAQLEPQRRKESASTSKVVGEAQAKLDAVRSKFAAGCFDKLLEEAAAATP